jgi:uncharacterized membrane protein YhfC
MVFSAIMAIGIPIGLFIFFYKKYKSPILPMIIGAVAFPIFALVLERSVHSIVLGNFNLTAKPFFYVVYGVLMAGIFEETARFISFNMLRKKYNGINSALSYGVGHGGIEAILFTGIAMINSIAISILINVGSTETITGSLQGVTLEQANMQIANLVAIPSYQFLIGGIERLFALGVQVSLSTIVFYAVFGKNKWWLYPIAILIHALIDVPAILMQIGIIKNLFLVEGLICISCVVLILLAINIHKRLKPNIEKILE